MQGLDRLKSGDKIVRGIGPTRPTLTFFRLWWKETFLREAISVGVAIVRIGVVSGYFKSIGVGPVWVRLVLGLVPERIKGERDSRPPSFASGRRDLTVVPTEVEFNIEYSTAHVSRSCVFRSTLAVASYRRHSALSRRVERTSLRTRSVPFRVFVFVWFVWFVWFAPCLVNLEDMVTVLNLVGGKHVMDFPKKQSTFAPKEVSEISFHLFPLLVVLVWQHYIAIHNNHLWCVFFAVLNSFTCHFRYWKFPFKPL